MKVIDFLCSGCKKMLKVVRYYAESLLKKLLSFLSLKRDSIRIYFMVEESLKKCSVIISELSSHFCLYSLIIVLYSLRIPSLCSIYECLPVYPIFDFLSQSLCWFSFLNLVTDWFFCYIQNLISRHAVIISQLHELFLSQCDCFFHAF